MVLFPNAKINLGLSITGKRKDGYHDIETIMYPIPLKDVLELIVSEKEKSVFRFSGIPLKCETEENLIYKAWQLLQNDFDLPPVNVHLHKVIPSGAGLGGGSSDAVGMIELVDRVFRIGISIDEKKAYARKLGMDCIFFVENKPVLAYERGDRFEPVGLKMKDFHLVIVKPEVHVNTRTAYQNAHIQQSKIPIKEIIARPVEGWRNLLHNNFEETIFPAYPKIGEIKKTLYQNDALYASMSGSGAAVYGIFNKFTDLRILFPGYFYWSGLL